jgi:GT2 family glycosyltransferase
VKISVNILTWNTASTLHETLHVLKEELKGIDHEVIIVDNGSNDGSQDYATIANKENLGISVGKNQGIKASVGEYILLIDGDIVPVPNSIRCLIKYLDEHPDIDALGFRPNRFSNQKNKNGQNHHEDYCEKLHDIREHDGHCIYYGIYRRGVFDKVMLDENYGVGYGYEDLDFYMQMKQAGIKQYICDINHTNGKYYHEINSSIRNMGYQKYIDSSKERWKLFQSKWGNQTVGAIC